MSEAAVVIPALNESATIVEVVKGVRGGALPIVVDDGSSDDTGALARAAGAHVVRHETSRGYEAALQSGFEAAAALGARCVATFDADGQFAPESLWEALAPVTAGTADLVIGIRPSPQRMAEALFGFYTRARFGVPDILCGLKAYSIDLFHLHGRFDGTHSVGTELALFGLRRRVRTVMIQVPVRPRRDRPRFDSSFRANRRIARAAIAAIRADLASVWPR